MNLNQPTGKSNWQTPQWLLVAVREALGIPAFSYDPASNWSNPTGAKVFSTPETDGLSVDWNDPILGKYLWLNPPWGKASPIQPWVEKFCGYQGVGTMLCPANTGSKWWHLAVSAPGAIPVFFEGRVNYIDPATGEEMKGCPFDSCLITKNWSGGHLSGLRASLLGRKPPRRFYTQVLPHGSWK
jgi:hypothetical protein